MADKPADKADQVKIHAPDRSLHAKIGHANLDQILTPQIIKAAESKIAASSEKFLDDSLEAMQELERSFAVLHQAPMETAAHLPIIINAAFSMKTKTGFVGYDLVWAVAKSLQIFCEIRTGKACTTKDFEIMRWHISSIKQLFDGKIKGDGGAVGAAILAEIERLTAAK